VNGSAGAWFPFLLLGLAFVLLVVLPGRARARTAQRTQAMQSELAVGSEVMTTSGLHGRVAALGDSTVDLEISPGVVVRWARAAIAQINRPEDTDVSMDGTTTTGPADPAETDAADPTQTDSDKHPDQREPGA
jgi:preprotein translocase subunit YajC